MQQVVAVMGRGVVDAGTPIATGDDLGITRGDGCFDATLVAWDGEGWLVRMRLTDWDADRGQLLHGDAVVPAMRHHAWLNRLES